MVSDATKSTSNEVKDRSDIKLKEKSTVMNSNDSVLDENKGDNLPESNLINGGMEKPNNDFVIRDGFPALRLPGSVGWNTNNEEPIPNHSFQVNPNTLKMLSNNEEDNIVDDMKRGGIVNSPSWETLWEDASTVFSARTREDDAAYSVGTTYFCPCEMKPRCALEALALSIFQMHTKRLEPGVVIPEQSGVEWWTLVMDANNDKDSSDNDRNDDDNDEDNDDDDEVGMHFDADYGLEEQAPNLLLHPRLATVTYLTSVGTPTLILVQQSPPPADTQKKTLQGSIRKGWLSHPVQGKHISFDGRLLHGAPSSFFPPCTRRNKNKASTDESKEWDWESEPPAKKSKLNETECNNKNLSTTKNQLPLGQHRITLLVNIWINHCPLDAELLEDEIIEHLKTPWEKGTDLKQQKCFEWCENDTSDVTELPIFSLKAAKPTSPNSFDLSNKDGIEAAGEEEVVIGGRLITISYGATMEDFHEASEAARNTKSGCIELELGREVIALTVGEEVESDDDKDENDF